MDMSQFVTEDEFKPQVEIKQQEDKFVTEDQYKSSLVSPSSTKPETVYEMGDDGALRPVSGWKKNVFSFLYGNTSTARGEMQLAGVAPDFLKDLEEIQKRFREGPDGGSVKASEFIGMFSDPQPWALPVAKAGASLKTISLYGALGGGMAGFLGYTEDGENRIMNAGLGAAGGAILAPAIVGLVRGLKKIPVKELLNVFDRDMVQATRLMNGIDDAIVKQRAQGIADIDALQGAMKMYGAGAEDLHYAMKLTNRMPITVDDDMARMLADDVGTEILNNFKKGGAITNALRPITDRLEAIDKKTWWAVQKHFQKFTENFHKTVAKGEDFFNAINSLSKEQQRLVNRALKNGDFDLIKATLSGNQKALDSFEAIQQVHKTLFKDLKRVGYKDLEEIPNYWHRIVQDREKLFDIINASKKPGQKESGLVGLLKKELNKAAQEGPISSQEESMIINKVMRGYFGKEAPIAAARERHISRLPDKFLDAYADPKREFHMYVRQALSDIYKRELFGRHINLKKGINVVDIDKTLGSWLSENKALIDSPAATEDMRRMLSALFYLGEKPMNQKLQAIKNVGYMMTLGNPYSTLTQAQDVALSLYRNGVFNTAKAVIGKKHWTAAEAGFKEVADELTSSPMHTAKYLTRNLKWVGFEGMDRFGKTTYMNAAFNKYSTLANSPKGIEKIKSRYASTMDSGEFIQLVDDLRNKRITEDVKTLLFSELVDVQPIHRGALPVKYNEMPNGKVMYMLKTYWVKQLNLLYNDVAKKMVTGHKLEATRNLALLSTYYAMLGVPVALLKQGITNIGGYLTGKETKEIQVEDIPDIAFESVFKNFLGSSYMLKKAAHGEWGNTLVNLAAPPLNVIDNIGRDVWKNATMKEDDVVSMEALKNVPFFGKMAYYWFGGGIEKEVEKETKRKKKEESAAFNIFHKPTREEQLFINLGLRE